MTSNMVIASIPLLRSRGIYIQGNLIPMHMNRGSNTYYSILFTFCQAKFIKCMNFRLNYTITNKLLTNIFIYVIFKL